MKSAASYICSTIGRKQLVGLTGLGLSFFILTHVLGNLLMFVSPRAYNMYSHNLITNPLIYFAEAGLLLIFAAHLAIALKLSLKNYLSRPQGYAKAASGPKATSPVTKTMWFQGILIFVFVVLHVLTFKFGTHYEVTYDGLVVRDLFRLVVEVFQEPVYVAWYFFSMIILGFHLSHGVASAFQTLGFNHPRHTPIIRKISVGFALFIAVGFISQPIYMFFFHNSSV